MVFRLFCSVTIFLLCCQVLRPDSYIREGVGFENLTPQKSIGDKTSLPLSEYKRKQSQSIDTRGDCFGVSAPRNDIFR